MVADKLVTEVAFVSKVSMVLTGSVGSRNPKLQNPSMVHWPFLGHDGCFWGCSDLLSCS